MNPVDQVGSTHTRNTQCHQRNQGWIGLCNQYVAESRQTMEHLKAALERRGCTFDDVVKCTVFLVDMAEWPAFNEVYASYFHGHFPARSALGVSALARGARVEVECIARLPDGR